MSVQRLAVPGTTALPARRAPKGRGKTEPERIRAERSIVLPRPSLAPAQHLLAHLGRSVLVQLMLAMALISVAAVVYLNQASKQSVIEFNITDLQRQLVQSNLTNANLYATATSLTSLNRIEPLATSQLHMAPPSQANTLWLRPNVPYVAPLLPDTPAGSAEQQSQPLAWMQHAVQFVVGQL